MNIQHLRGIAENILIEYMDRDIEFDVVYENESTEGLDSDELLYIHALINGASVRSVSMPEPKGKK